MLKTLAAHRKLALVPQIGVEILLFQRSAMAPAMKTIQDAPVLYLYGVTKTSIAPTRKISGVDGEATLATIRCAGLVCWVSEVPRSEFADNLSRNMENLDWLAAMSTRHRSAVAAIAEVNDVVPARFGTVFHNELSLQADVEEQRPLLQANLKRIKGNEEWAVKVFTLRAKHRELPRPRGDKGDPQAKLTRRTCKAEVADGEIARLAQALGKLSVATTEEGKISGSRTDLQYQISLLLKRVNRKKLETVLKRFSNEWKGMRHIECTGPRPPYSFMSRNAG